MMHRVVVACCFESACVCVAAFKHRWPVCSFACCQFTFVYIGVITVS